MRLTDNRTGLDVLPRDECLRLLAAEEVGRFVTIASGRVHIVPVNYVLDDETIVFRTDPGTKLNAAGRSTAAFEIDGFDRTTKTGWSVVVHGRAEEMSTFDGPARAKPLRDLGVDPWAGGEKRHWVGIHALTISGRRVHTHHQAGAPS